MTQIEKTVDIDCPLISLESNLKSKPIEINVESPPSLIQPPTVEAMDRKELQVIKLIATSNSAHKKIILS